MTMDGHKLFKAARVLWKLEIQTVLLTIVPIGLFSAICLVLTSPLLYDRAERLLIPLYNGLNWNNWLFSLVLLIIFVMAHLGANIIIIKVIKNTRYQVFTNILVLTILSAIFVSLMIIHFSSLCYI
jgi:TctA family transporter